ncbi:MAG: hypothetical protein GC191_16655 [Azospirillum sp.]|nr:hypothetical protein [Azospirillum sp.]
MRKVLIALTVVLLALAPAAAFAQHGPKRETYQFGLRPLPPAQAKVARIINIGANAMNGAVIFNMLSGYLGLVSWAAWGAGIAASTAVGGIAGDVFYKEPTY